MPLAIAYFGLPLGALLLRHDGHELVSVALSRTDAVGYRRARRRFGERLSVRPDVHRRAFHDKLRALEVDLVVSWFWTTRLPMDLVEIAPLGGIGVHPSLLPRHRGPDPYFWAIYQGDEVTGVTAHRIAADYDTGDILGQRTLRLEPTWNAWNLARALDRPSLALLRATVSAFASEVPPTAHPQDASGATEAPAPSDELMELVWNIPTDEVLRRVRALAPSPGAFFAFGEHVITVTAARRATAVPRVLLPGEACVTGEGVVVRTLDGAIVIVSADIDEEPADPAAVIGLFGQDVVP